MAFDAIVAEHGTTVLRVCRATLGRAGASDEADDAWSETFLSALRAWPELPPDANVEAWLVTIAHRRAVDVVRARGRRAAPAPPERLPEGHDPRPTTSAAPRPRGVPGAADELADLYAALADLPDKQRRAVAYHHLAGLPHAEVAEVLGGTPAAARRACADGIAALRGRLTPKETP